MVSAFAGLWHISRHTLPPTFDDAWYLEISARLFHALCAGEFAELYKIYANAFLFKAPLISVVPIPFYIFLGVSIDTALLANIAAIFILAFYIYHLGKEHFNESVGGLAVIIALTLPMLFGMSRRFFAEFILTACVTAFAYHVLASNALTQHRHNKIIGVLLGLGLLLKSLFLFYMMGPIAELLWRQYDGSPKAFIKKLEKPIKTILYIAIPIALTWYAHNLLYAVGYIFRASFGDIASHYGSTDVFAWATLLRYLNSLISDGPSYYYAVAAAAMGIALYLRERPRWSNLHTAWESSPGLRMILLWPILPWAVASFGVNKDIRFMTPCLPAFALLLAVGLDRLIPKGPRRKVFLTLFFLFPFNQFSLQTFGASLLPEITLGPISFLKRRTNYSEAPYGPPYAEKREIQAFVDTLQEEAAKNGTPRATFVFGAETSNLNANNLNYYSARKNHGIHFVSYGYAESRVEKTIARISDKGAEYILTADGIPESYIPQSVRVIDAQIRTLMHKKHLPFQLTRTIPISKTVRASLYKRTGPIHIIGALNKTP